VEEGIRRTRHRAGLDCLRISVIQNRERLRFHWSLLAGFVLLAPAILTTTFALDPTGGVLSGWTTTFAQVRAASALHLNSWLILSLFAAYLAPLGILGLGLAAMQRSPWLATAGMAAGWIGSIPWSMFAMVFSLTIVLAHEPTSEATRIIEALSGTAPVLILQGGWVIGHLLGYVLLGLALARSRVIPAWVTGLMIAGVPLQMAAYAPPHRGYLQVIGFALIFVASLPVARSLLKRSIR
jgi:hypothetical protein